MRKRQQSSSSSFSPSLTTLNSVKPVKSKYFTIDSYFSSTTTNKRFKADINNVTKNKDATTPTKQKTPDVPVLKENFAAGDSGKQEQCPICQALILTESVSFDVHVNLCLDRQQQQEQQEEKGITQQDQELYLVESARQASTKESIQLGDADQLPECTEPEWSSIDNQLRTLSPEPDSSFNLKEKFSYNGCSAVKEARKDEEEKESIQTGSEAATTTNTLTKDNSSNAAVESMSPASWKSAFSFSSPSSTISKSSVTAVLQPIDNNVSNNFLLSRKPIANKKKKTCPFYKWVKDTHFVVDAFNYGLVPNCDGYFLTHFHSDHFGGLTSKWSHGPIYCSKVTANLVKQELRVDPRYIHPLPMNQLYPIPTITKAQGTTATEVEVALIDANHCPGSVLFLFVINKKIRHLHTGDFRAAPKICLHPLLRQPENPPICNLYLDTTYLNPKYAFPAQEECIQAVCNAVLAEIDGTAIAEKRPCAPSILEKWIRQPLFGRMSDKDNLCKSGSKQGPEKHEDLMTENDAFKLMMSKSKPKNSKLLIVVGTYTIGKERVFINIARLLKCKVYAPSKKKRILLCQEDQELKSMLTNDPTEAQVHVVSLREIRADTMFAYLNQYKANFDRLLAFKPTGWTFKSTDTQTLDMKFAHLCEIIIPPADRSLSLSPQYSSKKDNGKVKIFGVPYSEHSSFRELASFIASLEIKSIIPTVNNHDIDSMRVYLDRWQEEKRSKKIEVVAYPNEDHW